MDEAEAIPVGVKLIIAFFGICAFFFLVGQGGAVIDYDWAADRGLQLSSDALDPVMVEVSRGIGLADVAVAVPLFIVAIVGLWRRRFWGAVASWLALGINLYWPIVAWAKQAFVVEADMKADPFSFGTHAMLAFVVVASILASLYLARHQALFD